MTEVNFGASGGPLGSQNGTQKLPRDMKNEFRNEVYKMMVDFDENVPPQGALGTLGEASCAPKWSPGQPPGRPETAK